jgi:bifunctional UDP-N-acetylglucosamine pyrophosphorylase/glucosamine-1-phosphate N-acetyltransferase
MELGESTALGQCVRWGEVRVLNPEARAGLAALPADAPVLVLLAAGKGTRFGPCPKCAQRVHGKPLARHSIDAFREFSPNPVIGIVGYCHQEVMAALGPGPLYLLSQGESAGTAYAAYEALSLAELERHNPILVIAMGDRIVPASIFPKLLATYRAGQREADLAFLTTICPPPANHGKGRLLRDTEGRVLRIVEQRDVDALAGASLRQAHNDLSEVNGSLYALRARTLRRHLAGLRNHNPQRQYYLSDLVESISRQGGILRTATVTPLDPEYGLLSVNANRPEDLAQMDALLRAQASGDGGEPLPPQAPVISPAPTP